MIKFTQKLIIVSEKFPATLLEVEILREGAIAYPSDLASLSLPDLPKDRGVIISGRLLPAWLFLGISESLIGYPWKAALDPQLGGAVVTKTAAPNTPKIGEVVTLPK